MFKKNKIFFFMILSMISLISVGFSSWTINTQPEEKQAKGSLDTSNVIYSKDYLDIDERNPVEVFEYCETGYLKVNNGKKTVDQEGYIIAYFKIDLKKCRELFSDTEKNLTTEISLRYENNNPTPLNIFKNDESKRTINYNVLDNNSTPQNININHSVDSSQIDYKRYVINMTFNNILSLSQDYYYFKIEYKFFAETGAYFTNNIFNCLYRDNVEFGFNLGMKITAS